MYPRGIRSIFVVAVFAAVLAASAFGNDDFKTQITIGLKMFREEGLIRETLFRFLRANELHPGNAGVLNDIAVAYEMTGQSAKAREYYEKALEIAPDHPTIKKNYDAFIDWYGLSEGGKFDPASSPSSSDPQKAANWKREKVQFGLSPRGGSIVARGKTVAIMPFLRAGDNPELEGGDSLDLFIGKTMKRTRLAGEVIFPDPGTYPTEDITALSQNAEFWKSLGEKTRANLFVVGSVEFHAYEKEEYRTEPYTSPGGAVHERNILIEQSGFEIDVVMFVISGNGTAFYSAKKRKFYPFSFESGGGEGNPLFEDRARSVKKGFEEISRELVKPFGPEFTPAIRYFLEP